MNAKIVGLTRYPQKGEPGVPLSEIKLIKGAGVEGDFHQGGERQVSLLSAEARRWMEAQSENGLCFKRFRENILLEGLPLDELEGGNLLFVGNVVLRISAVNKHCFSECKLFSGGMDCRLSKCAVFATVEQGGVIQIDDALSVRAPE